MSFTLTHTRSELVGLKSHERSEAKVTKMVWFNASLRFQLCETGIDGFILASPIKPTFTGIDGWVSGQ